ncbi:hypothetical protein J1614_004632 [Plenodomus biglobosus]|nr:hypothetical protein J1614_004632 [Plenodomus biglobosus]
MSAAKTPFSSRRQKQDEANTTQASIKDESTTSDNEDEDDGKTTYRPRPQLPRPQVNLRSLADLMRGLEDGSIDVDPDYQREVVWTADRMTGLVNSLMENFYIPSIILNGKQSRIVEGEKSTFSTTYVCVDGKQRLSSVRAFIKGMIPCHDHRGEKWWFSDEGGRRRKVFPDATQRAFLNKDFVAYQFEGLSQEQEEDLFARVQMGMTLTAAEKMRASSGPWQELARLFVDDFPNVYSLTKDRARAKDFQLTLSCFSQILEVMHPTATTGIPTLKTNHTALPKFLSNKGLVDDGTKSHLASVWNTFNELIESDPDTFTNARKYLGGVQTFAPVEMVGVTIMISMYSDTRNDRLLLGDIRAFREELRKHFVDLRLNATTWKFVWEYLDELEVIRGAVDGTTVGRRLIDPAPGPSFMAPPSSTSTASASASALSGSTQAKSTTRRSCPSIVPPPPNVKSAAISEPNSASHKSSQKKATLHQPVNANISIRASTPPSQIRSPKRQRTDPGPSSSMLRHMNNSVGSHQLSREVLAPLGLQDIKSSPSPSIRSSIDLEQSLFIPETVGINTAALPQHQTVNPKEPMPQAACSAYNTGSSSKGQLQQIPPKIPLPLSSQGRQISELHGPHTSTTHFASPQLPSITTFSSRLSSSQPTQQPKTSKPHSLIGIGAYAPTKIQEQWEGIVRSVSPQVSHPVILAPLSAQTPSSKRKNVARPTYKQYQEAIDLTNDSDSEQEQEWIERERQSLLSSFRGKSTTGKQPHAKNVLTAAPGSAPTHGSSNVTAEATLTDAHAMSNNPYAKYKS